MARLPLAAVQREGLVSTPSRVAPESASQVYVRGAVLVANAGNVEEAGANPRSIVGVAEQAGKNLGAGLGVSRFVPALPHIVFEGSVDKASALGTQGVLAAHLYAELGLTKDAAGVWYIDVDKTTGGTNTIARIVELVDPVGTTQGRLRFIVLHEVSVFFT